MRSRRRYQNQIEILQGTLDMLVLRTLLWGAQHGQGIGQAIRANSGELLQVETGSLYPALHRLEKSGWVASDWKTSDKGQRAKYLTASRPQAGNSCSRRNRSGTCWSKRSRAS